ncbi:MAG: hypothetical protein A3H27_13455 [Acidobacteria bacterium RIFCSPLOWO2_02_FULL_59_13]|nr:MAG: hypothetical protein A3H27_13455 [Acidobacteria bacterium RIFCSPLOWO2_02_FULL_59_13]
MVSARLLLDVSPALYAAYGRLRAMTQERRIHAEQRLYERLAGTGPAARPLVERLRDRLRARNIARSRSGEGEWHVLYATMPSDWELHNIPPELSRVARMSRYYYSERGFDPLGRAWVNRRHRLDKDLLEFVHELNAREPIDVFLGYLSGWHIAPETLRAIGALGIVTCGFHLDDKLSFRGEWAGGRWEGPAALAAAYDLNLTSAPSSIVKYEAEGGLAMFWPEAANPRHFRPLDTPFEYDVSFVGACYGYRPVLIRFLRSRGINVATVGPGWPDGPISEAEMVAVYSRSRINLGFGGIGYSDREYCLKGRDFEVPMCGALYLTSHNPELALVFELDKEICTYTSPEDCLRKIEALLGNPERAAALRLAARKCCIEKHTWANRFRELFDLLDRAASG